MSKIIGQVCFNFAAAIFILASILTSIKGQDSTQLFQTALLCIITANTIK